MGDAGQLAGPTVGPPPPVRVKAALGAKQQRQQVPLAHTVDRAVVDLRHQRPGAVGHPADEQQLPEGSGAVQVQAGEADGFGAHRGLVGVTTQVGEGEVVIEVEVGVIDPPRSPHDE